MQLWRAHNGEPATAATATVIAPRPPMYVILHAEAAHQASTNGDWRVGLLLCIVRANHRALILYYIAVDRLGSKTIQVDTNAVIF